MAEVLTNLRQSSFSDLSEEVKKQTIKFGLRRRKAFSLKADIFQTNEIKAKVS